MSAPVEVLAVLDDLNGNTSSLELGARVERVRAAVAELVAEAQRVADGTTEDLHYLRAALARVQGVQS